MTNQYVITEEFLHQMENGYQLKSLAKIIRSRPLSQELKAERERVIDIILGWIHLYFTPDVLKNIKKLRDKP